MLLGTPLSTSLTQFYADGRARLHCTHGYDLAWWTIVHAGRAEKVRRYDSIVPDHPPGREVEVTLRVNDVPTLSWRVVDDIILGPEPFEGRHAMKGFVGWAVDNLEGDAKIESVFPKGHSLLFGTGAQHAADFGAAGEQERRLAADDLEMFFLGDRDVARLGQLIQLAFDHPQGHVAQQADDVERVLR